MGKLSGVYLVCKFAHEKTVERKKVYIKSLNREGERDIEKIAFNSKYYPKKLRKIKEPPEILYAEGNLELLNTYAISIIGSRACSMNGINNAKKFAKDLSKQGLTIISGMAVRHRHSSSYWNAGGKW